MQHSTRRSSLPREPIPICFLIDRLIRGGTELFVLRLAAGLDRARFAPSLVLLDDPRAPLALAAGLEGPLLRLRVHRLRDPRFLPSALRLAAFLRRQRVAVLQLHHPMPTAVGLAAALFAPRARLVRTRFNLGYWITPMGRRFERLAARSCDVTIANCEAARAALLAEAPPPPGGIEVIANGVETERLAVLERKASSAAPRIGLLANLRPVKEPATFVRAAALLTSRWPRATFEIGGEGELRDPTLRLADSLGLGSRFRLRGEVADAVEFVADLDVAVLCSSSEALPNALLEYMAAARPIVATAVGGVPEAVRDGREGLLVPTGDERRLAEAIDRLLSDPALARRLGDAARARCLATYPMSAAVAAFSTLYESLAARAGPPLRRRRSHAVAVPELDRGRRDHSPVEP